MNVPNNRKLITYEIMIFGSLQMYLGLCLRHLDLTLIGVINNRLNITP